MDRPERLAERLGDLLDAGPLPDGDRALVVVFASCVFGAAEAELVLRLAHQRSLPGEPILELLLQLSLFAGYPRCINALAAFRQTFGQDVGAGSPKLLDDDVGRRRREGEALFERIYGDNTERVLADLTAYHPELRDWILVGAYGRVLARPALSARLRELAAVAALIVSGDVRQLSSHARGAIHCGATPREVEAVVDLVAPLIDEDARARARRILDRSLFS